tara:strand:- start:872 stop:1549 length:678 start_codon:yes stop_codon:yes gene_type:complete
VNIIVPFKLDSTRCARKNVREFHDGKSLLDIAIENLKKGNHNIYLVHADSKEIFDITEKHEVNHIIVNNTSNMWSEVVVDLTDRLLEAFDENELICLWQCVIPLFWVHNKIEDFFSFAEHVFLNEDNRYKNIESVIPVYPFKDYLVDRHIQGVNFSPGSWHVPSQNLPELYYITPICVSTPTVYKKYKYSYSPNSIIWVAKGPYVDIDTEEEFKTAQTLWKASIG